MRIRGFESGCLSAWRGKDKATTSVVVTVVTYLPSMRTLYKIKYFDKPQKTHTILSTPAVAQNIEGLIY